MDSLREFSLFKHLRRTRVAGRILFSLFVLDFERICVGPLGLVLPVMIDEVVAALAEMVDGTLVLRQDFVQPSAT